ncbi:MAG: bacteriohemerythrin [Gammaproteobacteria bacterium]|nr:bacteriohemerythrin [Gammaproteobacteria bacterium]
MAIVWDNSLEIGIKVIDQQHMRIVEFINELEQAKKNNDQQAIADVLNDCVDYTLSHFAFEESLQEEAGYKFCKPHKKVHDLFTRRIQEYLERFELGEDITTELHTMLSRWIINHIKHDDADYVDCVKANLESNGHGDKEKHSGKSWFNRLFG